MKNSSVLKVGFIGTGRIAELHAIEYLQNPKTEIVALCDKNIDLAKAYAKSWELKDVKYFEDYQDLISLREIDIIEILVPHHLHKPIALEAMRSGKAISLQKPICLTLQDATELIETANEENIKFRVFENFIFYPPVMKAKSLIDDGKIGIPQTIRIKSNTGKSQTAWKVSAETDAWRQNVDQCGGGPLVFDDGIHSYSLAWYFMGDIAQEVHAWASTTKRPDGYVYDAPAMISFKFPGDKYGNLEVVYSPEMEIITNFYPQVDPLEITGTKGVIWINGGHGRLGGSTPVSIYTDGKIKNYNDVYTGFESGFINSTRHYIDAIFNNTTPLLTGSQAREILKFALAVEKSMQTSQSVKIDGK